MKELLKVEPTQYGIEEKQANELIGHLPQLKAERELLEKQYNDVIQMDIESPETSKVARELRLRIRDNRTKGIEVWHKTKKEFFLKGGQFVDAIKRMEIEVNQRMESNLEQIEKHFEIKESKRKEALKNERLEILEPFKDFVPFGIDLGEMDDSEFEKVLNGAKMQHEAKLESERKAEQERIERERAEAEERERIRKENEQLRKEAEERERLAKIEAEKRAKAEAERLAKEQAERKEREEKERKEREAYEAKLKAEREERERIEREERAKRLKLEAELKAKEEAERKAKEEEQARIEAELSKGDADKVCDLIADLENLKNKYSFKSAKNKKMYSNVCILIDKVIAHING